MSVVLPINLETANLMKIIHRQHVTKEDFSLNSYYIILISPVCLCLLNSLFAVCVSPYLVPLTSYRRVYIDKSVPTFLTGGQFKSIMQHHSRQDAADRCVENIAYMGNVSATYCVYAKCSTVGITPCPTRFWPLCF